MQDTASELYYELLETYFDEYYYLSHAKWKKKNHKYKPKKLFIKGYDYSVWRKNEEESTDKKELTNEEKSTDKEELANKKDSLDLSDILTLEDDEEVKEWKGLTILTPTNY